VFRSNNANRVLAYRELGPQFHRKRVTLESLDAQAITDMYSLTTLK